MSILQSSPSLHRDVMEIAEVAGMLWQKGWAERNGGNITVNVTESMHALNGEQMESLEANIPLDDSFPALAHQFFYCKGTGKRMRDLARAPMENGSIIRIEADGAHYSILADEVVVPTSELSSHLMVHAYLVASGSQYKATVHTHPIELVAMSHLSVFLNDTERPNRLTRTLWSMIPETLAFAPLGIGIVPYDVPGSVALAKATLDKIRDYDVTLWEKHGVFAAGKDVMDAFDQIDVLNKAAQIYETARAMGGEPEGMTMQQMRTVQEIFHLPTIRKG